MTFLAVCFLIYFAPALIASGRHHPSAAAIWWMNFFLGWTGIGWLMLLVWTLATPPVLPLYPAVTYFAPGNVSGRPPGWNPAGGSHDIICAACYRPLPGSANYCQMCGAGKREVA